MNDKLIYEDSKKYLTEDNAEALYQEAWVATLNAYAPYSNFKVGAAVLTWEGKIFQGCNIENASYGLTICAERIALGHTIARGCKDIKAIAVSTSKGGVPPCGACRQFINEFGSDIIIIYKKDDRIVQKFISELLPLGFVGKDLEL